MKADEFIISRLNDVFDERISSRVFKSSAVREAATTFRDSLQQIVNLQAMPGWVAGAMCELSNSWADACEQITGKRVWPKERWHERDVYEQIMATHHSIFAARKADFQDSFRMPDLHLLHVEHMNPEIPLASGFEAISKASLIYCWSAFEVLARSLFEGKLGRPAKGSFSKLCVIREQFRKGFALPSGSGTHQIIDSEQFAVLAQLRHLLVHRGGIIDQPFLDQTAQLNSLVSIRSHGLGARVSFDAKMNDQFVTPFIVKCVELIESVDDYV